ncbi:hypothetical protein HYN59_15590 [Flavobacterium album]|uniref:Fibronectin type-III domain-containing protein n=1 Tax=Flavobacterium album TaxID=2175091 RepID=A0A2S1R1M2_9FLAO|nr:T9SS type A sorting domain-containing protein [Flavobacterium album]AWH86441.1 hypothetical protein HYN59_15590 [Flavobacterium album]
MKKTIYFILFASLFWPYIALAQDCEPVNTPYTENFESAVLPAAPDCTSFQNGGAGNNWITANNPDPDFTTNTLEYIASPDNAADAWFFTRGINLTAGVDYRVFYSCGNSNDAAVERLNVYYGTAADAASMLTNITYPANVEITASEQLISLRINVEASGVYYFGFNAASDANQGNLFLDNIIVKEWTYQPPQNLKVTNVSNTAATLSWNFANVLEPGFFYQISIVSGTGDPVAGLTTATADILTLNSYYPLTPGETYSAYVRSFCQGSFTEWSEPVLFTTALCEEVATVPFLQDFESASVPAVPECALLVTGDTGNPWTTVNNPGNGFTDNALHYTGSDEQADAWYFEKGIYLEAGTPYRLSYTYGNNSATGTEKLASYLATSPNPASANAIGVHDNVTGGEPVHYAFENPITVTESGIYYIGFKVYSDAFEGHLYVDNIVLQEWPCNPPQNVVVSPITNTTATISWMANQENTSLGYFYDYNTTEIAPEGTGTMTMTPSLELNDLEPGTTYYFYIKSFCGPVNGEWTMVPFTTTDIMGTGGAAFAKMEVYPNPAKDVVRIKNTDNIDKVEVYNITGQLVHDQLVENTDAVINLEKLSSGLYLLKVYAMGEKKTVKILKQ